MLNVTIMSTVDPDISGAASGLLQATMMIGASLGVAILTAVYAGTVGTGEPASAELIASGMSAAFWTSSAIAALALLATLTLIPPHREKAPA